MEGEGFEIGDELAEPAGVVEPGLKTGPLLLGDLAGDRLAVDRAGPRQIRPVEHRRVALAATSWLATRRRARDEAAGEGEADLGQLGGDGCLGSSLGCSWLGHRLIFSCRRVSACADLEVYSVKVAGAGRG